jgi:hypothetical protein
MEYAREMFTATSPLSSVHHRNSATAAGRPLHPPFEDEGGSSVSVRTSRQGERKNVMIYSSSVEYPEIDQQSSEHKDECRGEWPPSQTRGNEALRPRTRLRMRCMQGKAPQHSAARSQMLTERNLVSTVPTQRPRRMRMLR